MGHDGMLPVTDAGLWYKRILAQGCHQPNRIMSSPLREHITQSGKPSGSVGTNLRGTKFHEGLVVGSQFTQKTNGFPVSWYPTTNPSWNFEPFELGTTLSILSDRLRGTKFHEGFVMGSQFAQKMIAFPVNWDPTTDPHADSVPVKFGPTLTEI